MIVLNDTHAGPNRVAGTTLASRLALRLFVVDQLKDLMGRHSETLLFNGDLLDRADIPLYDLQLVQEALESELKNGRPVVLVPGNHDLSKNSTVLSSFEFLARSLEKRFHNLTVMRSPGWAQEGIYVIPHLPNQEEFNVALDQVPPCKVLLLHCNYSNNFAAKADHSLNLSAEMALKLLDDRGVGTILIGHEHQARTALGGRVVIPGNQIPTSISDCLNCTEKLLTRIVDGVVTTERLYNIGDVYEEVNWRDVTEKGSERLFVRVTGEVLEGDTDKAYAAVSAARDACPNALVIGSSFQAEETTDHVAEIVQKVAGIDIVKELVSLVTHDQAMTAMLEEAVANLPQRGEGTC
jgi:DNA repair exonuclease SbcCD nuclease subunit